MPEQSLWSKYFCMIVLTYTTALPNSSMRLWKQWPQFHLLTMRRKSFIMYEKDYIQWLLLVFLVLYSAGWSASDDFVLFDLLDETVLYSEMYYVILQFLFLYFYLLMY